MIGVSRLRNYEIPYSVNTPLTRVQLHVHLDGALRHETIFELTKTKGLPLPGDGSFKDLQNYLIVKKGVSLKDFLSRFDVILNCIIGDLKALERIAYEFVEDSAKTGHVYVEARFCPHLLFAASADEAEAKKWVWKVSEALIKGLSRGQKDFKTKVSLIATCIRGLPKHTFEETLELVVDKNFHGGRIIGIDIAGDSANTAEELSLAEPSISLCSEAKKLGLPLSLHAGESGDCHQVVKALDTLHADRIGHGYRIIHNDDIYNRIRKEQVHLECCAWSSILTGSIHPHTFPHPIVKFFQDGFNVSINTDDPTVTGTSIEDEFRLLSKWGLNEMHFVKSSFNAARACFLNQNEKSDLIQDLSKKFGATL